MMLKDLEIKVEADHLESLTKATGLNAIAELIWNSLDADSKQISIKYTKDAMDSIETIFVEDDGHGIRYEEADNVFSTLGGSLKKQSLKSPNYRLLHGKEGKGRYKALSLGDLIEFQSVYNERGKYKRFTLLLDRNNLKRVKISTVDDLSGFSTTGFRVIIQNVNKKNTSFLLKDDAVHELQKLFAIYFSAYPDFYIDYNGIRLDFTKQIKNKCETSINYQAQDGVNYEFIFKIIEWSSECEKRLYYCNNAGVCYFESKLGIKARIPITLYIVSDYIEELRRQNVIEELDIVLIDITEKAKKYAREYILNRLHEYSKDFIDDLKREEIYPYTSPVSPEDKVESAKRQVFDIVALNVNEFVPSFNEQDKPNKKLTMTLLKQALENNAAGLHKILHEVIKLPDNRIAELSEILDKTSLDSIIDIMTEITDRLRIIYEIRQLLFDEKYKGKIKERKNLQKILIHETWLFGDDYTLGAQDVNLKNVLKAHLKWIGRNEFEEIILSEDNSKLKDIPDICLFKQYSLGEGGCFRNLVIEIKRPSKIITGIEIQQIMKYATAVQNDNRFEKEKTKWVFYLLATELDESAEMQCQSTDRPYGHLLKAQNMDVYVYKWNRLLNEAHTRHQYLKEKLNYNILENEEGIQLLKRRYEEYLPADIECDKL